MIRAGKLQQPAVQGWVSEHQPNDSRYERRTTGGQVTGNDLLYGGDGQDMLADGAGADSLHGSNGWDVKYGMEGNDSLSGGEGGDNLERITVNLSQIEGDPRQELPVNVACRIRSAEQGQTQHALIGGAGRDVMTLWEPMAVRDTIYFANGDSGRTLATIDRVEGFESGSDKIDLRAVGRLTFEDIDCSDLGASCYYDGRFLRIDAYGDRATDMIVEFAWVDALVASDFILA